MYSNCSTVQSSSGLDDWINKVKKTKIIILDFGILMLSIFLLLLQPGDQQKKERIDQVYCI